MEPGKRIRLGAWLRGGRTFLAALDEVIPRGLAAAEPPAAALAWLAAAGVDGVVLHAGVAHRHADLLAQTRLPWLLKLTSNSAWAADRSGRGPIGSVAQALTLGASGAALNIFLGAPRERQQLAALADAVAAGARGGLPIVAFINPPPTHPFDPAALAYAARVAAEIGADVVKTDWSGGPDFAQVTAACGVPLLVEDTPEPPTAAGTLATAAGALAAGAAGVLFGRRLWADPDRDQLAQALGRAIHPPPER
jgi:DhnA family fructose-bisphosphate aldolase class Ia